MKYKIGQRVKTTHLQFLIHSITEKDGEVFYDGVNEKDIIGVIKNDKNNKK